MTLMSKLDRMYTASRDLMPDAAHDLAVYTTTLYEHLQTLNVQAALAGDPAVLRSVLQAGGNVHDAMRIGVSSLNDCALAVEATADDYVENDEAARTDLRNLSAKVRDAAEPSDHGYVPPALDDPATPGATVLSDHGVPQVTPSTPDPVSVDQDRTDREQAEQDSADQHNRDRHRGA